MMCQATCSVCCVQDLIYSLPNWQIRSHQFPIGSGSRSWWSGSFQRAQLGEAGQPVRFRLSRAGARILTHCTVPNGSQGRLPVSVSADEQCIWPEGNFWGGMHELRVIPREKTLIVRFLPFHLRDFLPPLPESLGMGPFLIKGFFCTILLYCVWHNTQN